MTNFKEYLTEQLKNPEFKRRYELACQRERVIINRAMKGKFKRLWRLYYRIRGI